MLRKAILLAAFCIYACSVFGQVVEKNALEDDIIGRWKLIDIPVELQPKIYNKNPWPAKCQWYAYLKTSVLKSFDQSGPDANCDTMTPQEMEKVIAEIPPVVSWRYSFSPVYQKGLVIVSRSDVKGYIEIWEPHIVTEKFSKAGVDFLPGDLLLYFFDSNKKQIAWIRHLRRVE